MRLETVCQRFELWQRLGWMRPLEARFAAFMGELDPDGDPRVPLAAGLVSHALSRGHVCLDIESLVADPARWLALPSEEDDRALPESVDAEDLDRARRGLGEALRAMDPRDWIGALEGSRLVSGGEGTTPLVLEGPRLYLRRNWAAGREVVADLAARGRRELQVETSELGPLFDAMFKAGDSSPGPDWQKVACALALRHGFSIITGGPGTGKTWTLVKLLGLLQAVNRAGGAERPLRVLLAAPTGKAAARMTESVRINWEALPEGFRNEAWRPEEARTLHRLLGSRPGSRHFRHQRDNPVQADVVIVDEASMIDLQMMQALVRGISPDTRLVLLGDKDQLASVEPGAVFGDLCRGADRAAFDAELGAWLETVCGEQVEVIGESPVNRLASQTVMLRKAHRFNEDIAALAEAVNDGQAERAVELLESRGPVLTRLQPERPDDSAVRGLFVDEGHARYLESVNRPEWLGSSDPEAVARAARRDEELKAWARDCLAGLARFQVLTGTRSGPWGVDETNRRIRRWLAEEGRVAFAGTWFHGRPVMVTRNDYRTGLMNGDVGLCLRWPLEAGGTALRVVFQKADGEIHHYSTSRLADCETAWAMTVHKSQGSEFEHAALMIPDRYNRVLGRELVYTGLTRARQRFTLVAPDPDVLQRAVALRTERASALFDPSRN